MINGFADYRARTARCAGGWFAVNYAAGPCCHSVGLDAMATLVGSCATFVDYQLVTTPRTGLLPTSSPHAGRRYDAALDGTYED